MMPAAHGGLACPNASGQRHLQNRNQLSSPPGEGPPGGSAGLLPLPEPPTAEVLHTWPCSLGCLHPQQMPGLSFSKRPLGTCASLCGSARGF